MILFIQYLRRFFFANSLGRNGNEIYKMRPRVTLKPIKISCVENLLGLKKNFDFFLVLTKKSFEAWGLLYDIHIQA